MSPSPPGGLRPSSTAVPPGGLRPSSNLLAERETFPILGERSYFASQCLGPCPREVQGDLLAYERGLARRSRVLPDWVERWQEMHRLTEALIEAPPGSVFLRDSATAAQAAVAASIEPIGERRRIVLARADFHSSRYLWHAQERRGFEAVEVPFGAGGHADPEALLAAIDERVRIVALSLVSPRTGALLDLAPIAAAARAAGALLFVDAFQAVGVVPVRVRELGAHVVVGGFHKWVGGGGTGLAFGYVDPGLCAELEPVYPGWTAHRELLGFDEAFEAAPSAEKFQQGMPAMEPIYTSRAGISWVLRVGVDRIRERSVALTSRILEGLRDGGLRVPTPTDADRRGGMVCVDLPDPERLVDALAEEGIDVDSRPGAGVRIGPHPCLEDEECDRLVARILR